jgi:ABC-type polysaccharide/polyol phosphate export permease
VLLLTIGPVAGLRLTPALGILPLSFLCIVCFSIGLGAMAAVVTVHFRDMQHLISVFLSAWFYLTPVIYPLEQIPHRFTYYFKLNPMFSMIAMFHRPIYDAMLPTPSELAAAVVTASAMLAVGLAVFWRNEDALIFAL